MGGNYMKKLEMVMMVFIIPILVIVQANDNSPPHHLLPPPLHPSYPFSSHSPLSPSNGDGISKIKLNVICPFKCLFVTLENLHKDRLERPDMDNETIARLFEEHYGICMNLCKGNQKNPKV